MNYDKLNIDILRNSKTDKDFIKFLRSQIKELSPKDADLLVIKNIYGQLTPYSQEDSKILMGLPENTPMRFITDDARQLWRHKKYWLLIDRVLYHLPEDLIKQFPTREALHYEIKIQLRLFKPHTTLGGHLEKLVDTINFMVMGEKRFKEFVNQAKDIILKYFLYNMDIEDFDKEIYSLIFD